MTPEDKVNEIEGYIAKLNTVAAKPDIKEILKGFEKNPAPRTGDRDDR